ncbi:MAG: hypothetical protein QY328_11830 [Anaerolineales bacterium]|jgi:predicted nucleic-acid-binding Zn-ribbon protein|nr:hypothetical protein [Anaerolineales bacterium]WKZ38946.1 MAG: hypothetical protein QY328_11830 [Anaerolineales bacterium]
MKFHKKCPECGNDEIYAKTVGARGGYGPDLLPGVGGFWAGGKFEIYVCGKCGYSQFYVPQKLLSDVKENFTRMK